MADFMIAFKRTGGWEGFYSNNKNDPGGETLYGISRVTGAHFPEFWKLVDEFKRNQTPSLRFPENMRGNQTLLGMLPPYYEKNYWRPLRLDEIINQGIANQVYDISVNKGQGVAARKMIAATGIDSKVVTNEIIKFINDAEKVKLD